MGYVQKLNTVDCYHGQNSSGCASKQAGRHEGTSSNVTPRMEFPSALRKMGFSSSLQHLGSL
jgi:hypothetical protein